MDVITDDLAELMPHTVTVAPVSTTNSYGAHTWGTAVSMSPCRVSYRVNQVRTADGEDKVARGTVVFGGVFSIDPEDKITLPDGSSPQMLQVENVADENGDHHTKVYFV